MSFEITHHFDMSKNTWNVSLSGEIDIFNSADMKAELLKLLDEKNAHLVIECSKLEYIDSTALGVLVAILKNVKLYSGEMRLINVRPNLLKLFKITNLDKVFIIEGGENV